MQIRNNYDKEVYNGDIGIIKDINSENQTVLVKIDERVVNYKYSELDKLVLAYAVSIHKSQGSEYPGVVMPCESLHDAAKKLVIIVGSKKAILVSVKNNKVAERYT